MAYRIVQDESLAQAVHRIAAEQARSALAALDQERDEPTAAAVHDFRKRCKKLRGLLRLLRPALGKQFKPLNRSFRDAARALAPIRDARARVDAFERLVRGWPGPVREDPCVITVRQGLVADAQTREAAVDEQAERVARARDRFEEGIGPLRGIEPDGSGRDAIVAGIAKTYKRGRKALKAVQSSPRPERFHEWRKRAKYTWYHLRLLSDAAPSLLKPLTRSFHALSDALGDAHDLAVLARHLQQDPDRYGGAEAVGRFCDNAGTVQRALEQQAIALGRRLYLESPACFSRRLGGYWSVWRRTGAEPAMKRLENIEPPAPQA